MLFTQHASATQLWGPGPAPTAKAPIHPEPAALRPRAYRRGKKVTLPPSNTPHVMFMLGFERISVCRFTIIKETWWSGDKLQNSGTKVRIVKNIQRWPKSLSSLVRILFGILSQFNTKVSLINNAFGNNLSEK